MQLHATGSSRVRNGSSSAGCVESALCVHLAKSRGYAPGSSDGHGLGL